MATKDLRPRWLRRVQRAWHDPYAALMHAIGDRTVGGNSVPGTWRSEKIDDRGPADVSFLSVMADNDAFGIVVRRYEGDPSDSRTWHQWEHVYLDLNRREARSLAWLIVRWFAADWFGLRRSLYYWALTKHLDLWRRNRPPAA